MEKRSKLNHLRFQEGPRQFLLPIVQATRCAVCGTPFEVRRRRGRPERFCSEPCRRVEHQGQKSDWGHKNARRGRFAAPAAPSAANHDSDDEPASH